MVYSYYLVFFGRPFAKWFAPSYWTVVCLSCLSSCSVCDVGVLWPNANSWMDQDETWHAGRPQPKRHCVMGTQLPPPQKGNTAPIFDPYILWPDGWMDQDATWHGGRSRVRHAHCVRWGSSSPSPKFFDVPEPIFAKLYFATRRGMLCGYS